MNKILTILIICLSTAAPTLSAQEKTNDLAKIQKDRERLINLVISLQKDFGDTLQDYAKLQKDYSGLLAQKAKPDNSAKVKDLQQKLNQALARLKSQKTTKRTGPSQALLEQDLVNLRNELHRERQELLVARARVIRLKQLEEQNKALEGKIARNAGQHAKAAKELQVIRTERDALRGQLKESMTKLQKSEEARKTLANRLDQMAKENLALKNTVRKQDTQLARLRKIEEEHKKALAAAADLRKENLRLVSLLAEREKQLANLQQHLAAEVKRTLEIPVLIQARQELEEKLNESSVEQEALTAKNGALTKVQDQLKNEILEVKARIADMRKQLAANETVMESVAALGQENKTLKENQDQLEATLGMAKAELVKSMGTRRLLEAQLAESQKFAAIADDLKQKNDGLLEEQGLLRNRLENTEDTLKESHKLCDQLQASVLTLASEKAKLTKAIAGNDARLKTLQIEASKKPEILASLNVLQKEKTELAAQLAKREDDLKKTRSELGRLQISASVAQKQLADLKRNNTQIDPIRYALGKAKILQQQERVLNQVKAVLKSFPSARFEIVGHTCDIGNATANLKLSQKRAKSLHDFLLSKAIPKDRLAFRGVGQNEPLVANTSEANRRLNRRVVVEILD